MIRKDNFSSGRKAFARKLTRVRLLVKREDVENEVNAIDSLYRTGGHEHIIEVLKHGWLQTTEKVYYIDMELADLSLAEYIAYLFHKKPLPSGISLQHDRFEPVFSSKHCTQLQRLQTTLIIGTHIANGLDFVHRIGYVHRDLKPANGKRLHVAPLLILVVLYCQRTKLWKLADFGFTSAGVSTPVTSGNGRGTEGYRSPELLKDERPQYSNRSDIWALGCILHELATGRRVFQYDLQTALYYDPQGPLPELPMLISYENKAWQDLISYCLRQFLSKESDERPNAGLASRRLALVAIYCTFLDSVKPQDMELLSSALFSPQYVVQPGLSLVERLLQLGKRYSMDGSDGVEGVVMKIITSRLKQNQQSMLLWFKHFTFLRTIGETLVGKQEHEVANLIFTGLVENSPESVYTSVTSAAIHGDIFSMNILLSRGADVKQRSANGWQPLHWAAWNGHEKVVEILLQHNVDVDKQDPILGK